MAVIIKRDLSFLWVLFGVLLACIFLLFFFWNKRLDSIQEKTEATENVEATPSAEPTFRVIRPATTQPTQAPSNTQPSTQEPPKVEVHQGDQSQSTNVVHPEPTTAPTPEPTKEPGIVESLLDRVL